MPTYHFDGDFVGMVERGEKRQTIRPRRMFNPTQPGDPLAFFALGMNEDPPRRPIMETVCAGVDPVKIAPDGWIELCGKRLNTPEAHAFAQAEGFDDLVTFHQFHIGFYDRADLEVIRW